MRSRNVPALLAAMAMTLAAAADVMPFTEDFETDASAWFDGAGAAPADWFASGGVDDGGYISGSFTVPDPAPPMGATLFRAQDEFGSSGNAFVGNWLTSGISQFSLFVRHDASMPLSLLLRFSGPGNFPGIFTVTAPVLPGDWTEVTVDIFAANPGLIPEGPSTFEGVFSNVGHVQAGIFPGDGLIGETITVDIDRVAIIPAPGAAVLLLLGGLRRRRRG